MRLFAAAVLVFALPVAGPVLGQEKIDLSKQLKQPEDWFKSAEGRRIADNVVSWQNANGGWWKGYDVSAPKAGATKSNDKPTLAPTGDRQGDWARTSTIDNKATFTELRFLARAYRATQDQKYRESFERGLKFLFDAQYPNGGWPQRFPLEDNYGRHITYNDNAMAGVMHLMLDVAEGKDDFAWTTAEQRAAAKKSFDQGVQCILDTQIKQDGKLTGWCQQHDAKTLAPTSARSYELPSIAGSESAEIVLLLMRIEQPEPRVKESIRSAVRWLEASKIAGKRVKDVRDPSLPKGRDQVLVDDHGAEPIWARFYDIETNRPFFVGRDGVKKWGFHEIEAERRAGYAYLRPFGATALKEYPKWAAKQGGNGDAGAAAR
jgi:PelA/Pel-15E family pectate lyase